MFAKVFTQIFDSSIADNWKTRHVFEDMLKLCDPDGIIDMTPEAISARTRVPIEMVLDAIAELEQPDPRSRTHKMDGARLKRVDPRRTWGWMIVNYSLYRNMKEEFDRKSYMRRYMRKRRGSRNVKPQSNASLTQSNKLNFSPLEGDVEVDGDVKDRGKQSPRDLASLADWQLDKDLARASKDYATQRDVKPRDKELFAYANGRLKALKAEKRRRASPAGELGILAKSIAPVPLEAKPAPTKPIPEANGTFAGVNGERWKELAKQAAEAVDRPGWAKESL